MYPILFLHWVKLDDTGARVPDFKSARYGSMVLLLCAVFMHTGINRFYGIVSHRADFCFWNLHAIPDALMHQTSAFVQLQSVSVYACHLVNVVIVVAAVTKLNSVQCTPFASLLFEISLFQTNFCACCCALHRIMHCIKHISIRSVEILQYYIE